MPRFSKALFYCTFNVHDEVLMHNPGLMRLAPESSQRKANKYQISFRNQFRGVSIDLCLGIT
ncbi:hypothetical protein, partial [Saccharicrinis sp. 156]|uniref:hypothetical protein n=1 Tax=Saccharicrinis sp. 156 TaxID=3417574 RepID=UPI003D358DB4